MSKIAVVTDSNSGITQAQAKELGVYVIPMPFYINEELFYEEITLSQEEFYKKLEEDAEISTSQPSPGDVMDLWEKLLEEYEEVIYLPMSSGLSSSCETAEALAMDYDGKVQVINNQRISVTLEQSVRDALWLAKNGKTALEIKKILEEEKLEASIYITVDTLKYLKKGGRVTVAGAALGTMLNIKPVLQIQGEKLDAFSKVRGFKSAKRAMFKALENDLNTRFLGKEDQIILGIAYTGVDDTEALKCEEELHEKFPQYEIIRAPLSLSISCHVGPGALGVGCMKKVNS